MVDVTIIFLVFLLPLGVPQSKKYSLFAFFYSQQHSLYDELHLNFFKNELHQYLMGQLATLHKSLALFGMSLRCFRKVYFRGA
jgi:hypothetical protein